MAQSVVVNGVTYSIPDVDEEDWGQNVTDYLVALSVIGSLTQSWINTVAVSSSPVTTISGRTYLVSTASARTLNLPAASLNAFIIVKDTTGGAASNNITIARNGSESIDGVAANKTLARAYGTWMLVCDGTNWFTINQFPDSGLVNTDVAAAAAIAHSKMAALTVSRALVSDGSGVVSVSAVTAAELAGLSGLTASRAVVTNGSGILSASAVTATEVGYLSGVTSAIQTQLNAKAPTASPTFTGTITTPLTASRALVTGASSELAVSAATATEVGYLSGVTSAIQTQLNGKAATTTTISAAGLATGGGDLSTNRTITVTAAVQADQETGTSNTVAVTPGTQVYHKSAAKAWAQFDGTGTVAIRDSHNVSSITDNGTGDYTFNFASAFSGTGYAACLTGGRTSAGGTVICMENMDNVLRSTTQLRVYSLTHTAGAVDVPNYSGIFFGDR